MSTKHVAGMAQVQEPNAWDQSFPYRYLTFHPHKQYEGCWKDCPLPHRTPEEADAYDKEQFEEELLARRIRVEARAALERVSE